VGFLQPTRKPYERLPFLFFQRDFDRFMCSLVHLHSRTSPPLPVVFSPGRNASHISAKYKAPAGPSTFVVRKRFPLSSAFPPVRLWARFFFQCLAPGAEPGFFASFLLGVPSSDCLPLTFIGSLIGRVLGSWRFCIDFFGSFRFPAGCPDPLNARTGSANVLSASGHPPPLPNSPR